MLELVEGRVVGSVDADEFLLQAVQLVVTLRIGLEESLQLLIHLPQIVLATLDVLLRFHQEDFLFLIVMLHSFS